MAGEHVSAPRGESASEWRSGAAPLVAATLGVAFGVALFYTTAGLFIAPMQKEFGWSRSAIVVGPLVGLIAAFATPFVGAIIDRFGARIVGIVGMALWVPCYVLLSFMPPQYGLFFSLALFIGIFCTASSAIAYGKAVAAHFDKNAGLALGIMNCGTSLAGMIMVPLIAFVILRYGWRAGYLAQGASVALIALPILFLFLREKAVVPTAAVSVQPSAGPGLGDALGDVRYWLLLLGIAAGGFAIGAFFSQLHPLMVSRGLDATAATGLVSVYAIALGAGRLGCGFALDRFRPALVATLFNAIAALGALQLSTASAGSTPALLIVACVTLVGAAHGAWANFTVYFPLRLYGRQSFALLAGIAGGVSSLSLSGGGLLFAMGYDHFGNYNLGVLLAAASFAVAATFFLMLNMRSLAQRPVPASS